MLAVVAASLAYPTSLVGDCFYTLGLAAIAVTLLLALVEFDQKPRRLTEEKLENFGLQRGIAVALLMQIGKIDDRHVRFF